VRFSIVTPSFRQFDWLTLCARSIEDQGVACEHIIQDAGTGPELESWVRARGKARLFVEKDAGMYDALNRGFARAEGEIFAWLNCDEQYLPGALAAVEARFAAEPTLEVLLADNLVVDPAGQYLAHRFSVRPTLNQLWVRFPVASCALFFRREVWRPFDTQWKSVGDWWWFRELMLHGARIGILRQFVSAFTETQVNLGLSAVTMPEHDRIMAARPWYVRAFRQAFLGMHRWKMWRSGAFGVRPFTYALHTHRGEATGGRETFHVDRPTAKWRRKR
jgi:glycosyltransferase involved in cell wall biosynthesis